MDEKDLPARGGERGDVDDLIFPAPSGPVTSSR